MKRRLGRIWNAIETSDIDIADASDRIKEHRERKERLEDAAADARAILSERRAYLDDVNTIAAYAKDMNPHFPYQPCRTCRIQQQNYLM